MTARKMNQGNKAGTIRLIMVAIKKLGLQEHEYREIYVLATGKDSLRAMDAKDLSRVVSALKNLGFKTEAKTRGVRLCDTPQARKARALWLTLKDLGALRSGSERSLLAYVKRLTGVERMEWLRPNQMAHLIETLKQWISRIKKGADHDSEECGQGHESS